jgi:putative lipoprotein
MKSLWRSVAGTLLVVVAVLLSACDEDATTPASGNGEEAKVATIEGSVFYRERMLLPPGAEVELQLQDISRADALATVMASVIITPEGGPPYEFAIDYDPASIDSRRRYALRGTISLDERLLFSSTEYIDPFAGGPVEVLVRQVAEPVSREGPTLEGTTWILRTLGSSHAVTGADGRSLDLQLVAAEQRAAGFSGCNRYTGGYSLEGESEHGTPLSFGMMAGTLMACPEGGGIEQPFLQMLGTVTAYRLEGEVLSLLADGEVVASFTPE